MSVFLLILVPLIGYGEWELTGPEGGEIMAILQSTQDAETLFAISGTNPTQVVTSVDYGATWSTISEFSGSTASDMVMTASGILVAFGSSRTWVSSDNGLTWDDYYFSNTHFQDATAHPTDGNILFAAGRAYNEGAWKMTYFYSSDAGITWDETELVSSSNTSYGHSVAVSTSNPDIILVGGYESVGGLSTPYVFKSMDGGAVFTDISPPGASYYFYGVAIHPSNPDILLAGATTKIYRSDDGGVTWSAGLSQYYNYDISFSEVDSDIVMAGGNDSKIYLSNDAGQTWSTVTTGLSGENIKWVVPDAANSSLAYTGSSSGFYSSADGGLSWNENNTGLVLGNVMSMETLGDEILLNMEDLGLFRAEEGEVANWTEVAMPLDCGNFCSMEAIGADTILAFEGSG